MAKKTFTEGSFVILSGISHHTVGETVDMTLTVNVNPGDTSVVGTSWEAVIELGKNWEMAISCNYDPDNSAQNIMISLYASEGAMLQGVQWYEDATGVHGGTALLTSAVITKAVGQVDKFSATFKGDGALGYT